MNSPVTDQPAGQVEAPDACVLIVEDNLCDFRLMARLLAFEGIRGFQWKTSGADVAAFANSLPNVDLILTDLYLPRVDGYQVLTQLREQPRFVDTRIVLVTAEATADSFQRARQAGFDGFVGKPISVARFADQVRRLLNGEAMWELK
jgi:two-component system cell cycle response regulator DivK